MEEILEEIKQNYEKFLEEAEKFLEKTKEKKNEGN